MLMSYDGNFLPPGALAPDEVVLDEITSVCWGRIEQQVFQAFLPIDGTSRDTGNTGSTDVLRAGLLLTKNAAGTAFVPWGTVTSLAADLIQGVLLSTVKMQRVGSNQARHMGYILVGGLVKSKALIIPGVSAPGIVDHEQETNIRAQMHPSCKFDDDPFGHLTT